jgi:hypothetical protein
MGKLSLIKIPITSGAYSEIWQGGVRFYNESQLDAIKTALFKYEQQNDTKAASAGITPTYSSGSVCSVMVALLLFWTDVNSSPSLFFSFTMHLLLREYSTNSWRSRLLGEMCQQGHSRIIFKVWVLRTTFKAFGQ